MNRLIFPSEDFPGPQPFFIATPDSWLALHAPTALLATRAIPSDDVPFAANVTVSWQRGRSGDEAEDIAASLASSLDPPGDVVGVDANPGWDGSAALVRHSAVVGSGVRVIQESLVIVGPPTSARTRDVFQVVGSWGEGNESDQETVREVVSSFAFIDVLAMEPD